MVHDLRGRGTHRRVHFRYLVTRGCTLYFRFVLPVYLLDIIDFSEIKRSLGRSGYVEARPYAAITGARLRLLFRGAVQQIRRGKMVDKVELNKLVHEILDYELGRISKDISLELAGLDSFESNAYGGRLQDRGVYYVGNPHGSAPMKHGLSMIKSAYDSGSPLPESIKANVRELFADVDALSG